MENAIEEDNTYSKILDSSIYLEASFQWIPGNEKADSLAKEGTTSTNIIYNRLRLEDVVGVLDARMWEETNEWYTQMSQTKWRKF